MSRRDVFNQLFDSGFDYNTYVKRSDRHQARMTQSFNATTSYVNQLDGNELELANGNLKILCIAENWCGDCGNGVPAIAKLAEKMKNWDFRIVPRDEYEDIVKQYYTTAGRMKIPVVIYADEEGEEIGRWVERPVQSYKFLAELQARKLPKEEYIEEYRSNPTFLPPIVSENIVDELLTIATKATTLLQILPKKRRENQ